MKHRKLGIGIGITVLVGGVLGAALLPTASSDHLQEMPDGKSVRFDHGGSNEWWVQVRVTGTGGAEATSVAARSTDGGWISLTRQTWTADRSWWAKSFHIPPGDEVQFRVTTPTVTNFESCWFTHPAGVEMCEPEEPTDASLDSLSHLRYVEDGTQEIAHLTYTLDEPVALEDLNELRFFQELVHGSGAYGFNVILGVNVAGTTYDADDMAWHLGATQHSATVLGTDTFLAMDGAPSDQFIVDAPDVPQWWTPNADGDGFAGGLIDPNCYATLQTVVNDCTDVRFEPTDKVHVIRLILGGSGSWNDMAMRATTDIDGTLTVGVQEAT